MNPTLSGTVRSKTVYLGAAVAVLAQFVGGDPGVFEPLIPAEYFSAFLRIAGSLLGAAVIAVRFVTDTSLADKAKE